MKIRTGFVSNSSSSSFTCCISGEVSVSGHGGIYEDFGPIECDCGHGFMPKYVLQIPDEPSIEEQRTLISSESFEGVIKWDKSWGEFESFEDLTDDQVRKLYGDAKNAIQEILNNDYNEYGLYEIPSCVCPVCSFDKISRSDRVKFMIRELVGTEGNFKSIDKDIKERFGSYEEFQKYIEGVKP